MMSEAYDQIQPEPSVLSGMSNSKVSGQLLAETMKAQMNQMKSILMKNTQDKIEEDEVK